MQKAEKLAISLGDDPLMALAQPAVQANTEAPTAKTRAPAPVAAPVPVSPSASSSASASAAPASLIPTSPDDLVVDSDRQRRKPRHENNAPMINNLFASASSGSGSVILPSAGGVTSFVSPTSIRPSHVNFSVSHSHSHPQHSIIGMPNHQRSIIAHNGGLFPRPVSQPYRVLFPPHDYSTVPPELSGEFDDDWNCHGEIPGEKLVMKIEKVHFLSETTVMSSQQQTEELSQGGSNHGHAPGQQVNHSDKGSFTGTLTMTTYQIFLEPVIEKRRPQPSVIGQLPSAQPTPPVLAVPLSSIDKLEVEKNRVRIRHDLMPVMEVTCKDGRLLRFAILEEMMKRAHDCLTSYVFPPKEEYLFAFYYKPKIPIPPHFDGWHLYSAIAEYKRLGIPNDTLRLSTINKDYHLSASYPALLCVPSEKFISDREIEAVANFRSRGRLPVCVWQHPKGRQTIWRSSQPKVGVNGARSPEDEKLLSLIGDLSRSDGIHIFDCRPKTNARANQLAGKGFENTDVYKNCKIFFMNIQNIHVMRDSIQKLVRACQQDSHSANFIHSVYSSGWLGHLSDILKATFEVVLAVDRDKKSVLSHCSDGWDRTSQLVSLAQLCLDPYYRTTEGFFVLIEKDWLSFGHQFHKRTGHGEKNHADDQRSPVFLQWLDAVFQLTQQFPRHFEFNSHLLVTIALHLYSCRFGTFFFNTEMMRKKTELNTKTQSLWTYLLCSPAAVNGEFTNPLYSPTGRGQAAEEEKLVPPPANAQFAVPSPAIPAGSVIFPSPGPKGSIMPFGGSAAGGGAGRFARSNMSRDFTPHQAHNPNLSVSNPAFGLLPSQSGGSYSVFGTSPSSFSVAPSSMPAGSIIQTAVGGNVSLLGSPVSPLSGVRPSGIGSFPNSMSPSAPIGSAISEPPEPITAVVEENFDFASTGSRSRSKIDADEIPADANAKKSSVGRGGGDGAYEPVGSVLYPSYSLKKIQLWSDYFLRWHSDQSEHGGIGPGSVPPYGSAATHFQSPEPVFHKHIRTLKYQKLVAEQVAIEAQNKIEAMEAEMRALRARLALAEKNTEKSELNGDQLSDAMDEKSGDALLSEILAAQLPNIQIQEAEQPVADALADGNAQAAAAAASNDAPAPSGTVSVEPENDYPDSSRDFSSSVFARNAAALQSEEAQRIASDLSSATITNAVEDDTSKEKDEP